MMINELPTELLIRIFRDFANISEGWPDIHYAGKLALLGKVCTWWRGVVTGTPALWAYVDGRQSSPAWKMALALSESHPLTVKLPRSHINWPLWSAVTLHLPRWKSAILSLSSDADLSSLESPAPTLEYFYLFRFGAEIDQTQTSVNLFGGSAPYLQHLQLWGVGLRDWDSPLLRGLRTLSLGQPGKAVERMIDVLGACPELERLHLEGLEQGQSLGTHQPPAVHLPRFRTLWLGSASSNAIVRLLSAMAVPHCNALSIINHTDVEPHPDLFSAITTFARPSFTSLDACGKQLSIYIRSNNSLNLTTSISSDAPDQFAFECIDPIGLAESLVNWALDILNMDAAATAPSTCTLYLAHDAITRPMTLLRRLKSLTLLEINSCGDMMSEIIEELAHPNVSSQGAQSWSCPSLNTIQLIDCTSVDAEALLQMVTRRTEAAVSDAQTGPTTVAALQKLYIESGPTFMDDQTFEAIRLVIGDDATDWVVWEGNDKSEDEESSGDDEESSDEDGSPDMAPVSAGYALNDED